MIRRLSKTILLLTLLTGWLGEPFAQEGSEGQRLYQAFVERQIPTELFIRKWTPAQKQAVISHVRYLQTQETSGPHYDDDTLFWMGEPTVRKQYLQEIRKSHIGPIGVVMRSGDPTIIEEIAPSIFVEEPDRDVGGVDTPARPTSFRLAFIITHILKNSPDFSDEVRQWAQKQSMVDGGVDYREMMRDWWRANEKFFKEKNYQAVRPGWDWLQKVQDDAAAADAAYEASQKKNAAVVPTPAPLPATPRPLPVPTPTPAPLEEPTHSYRGLIIAVLCLAILGAALFLTAKRPKE
jgi:hypothetical protein